MKRDAENAKAYRTFSEARAALIDEWVIQGWSIEDIATALYCSEFQVSLISRRNGRGPVDVSDEKSPPGEPA